MQGILGTVVLEAGNAWHYTGRHFPEQDALHLGSCSCSGQYLSICQALPEALQLPRGKAFPDKKKERNSRWSHLKSSLANKVLPGFAASQVPVPGGTWCYQVSFFPSTFPVTLPSSFSSLILPAGHWKGIQKPSWENQGGFKPNISYLLRSKENWKIFDFGHLSFLPLYCSWWAECVLVAWMSSNWEFPDL